MLMAVAPEVSSQAETGLLAPKEAAPEFEASNRKANEISTPTATMKGMKKETPDIKWRYIAFRSISSPMGQLFVDQAKSYVCARWRRSPAIVRVSFSASF